MKPCKHKERVNEVYTGHKPVPLNLANKVFKSICKIIIKKDEEKKDNKNGNEEENYGTGFFMKFSDSLKYLITNHHLISPKKNEEIKIEIYNKKTMNLNLNNRKIKYLEEPKDITAIEIIDSDPIYNDIEFLDYDNNYDKNGYSMYKDTDIFTVEHPFGSDAACASGVILGVDDYECDHNIPTESGSSGCPIILLNNNKNSIQVIGIHKNGDKQEKINGGTFIGEIINEILGKKVEDKNYISANIYIEKENMNVRILNSYEEYMRNERPNNQLDNDMINEKEIKECEIKINDELIPFNYFYKFEKAGNYTIKYSFKNALTKTNFMFYNCEVLQEIDFSNFSSKNVTNMSFMFYGCKSLENINISNFKKSTDMSYMFYYCSSLKKINLSKLKTQNVTNMNFMFSGCSSLSDINLSNINIQNVTSMRFMFKDCISLKNIDLSVFNNKNDCDKKNMFLGCPSSLKNKFKNI